MRLILIRKNRDGNNLRRAQASMSVSVGAFGSGEEIKWQEEVKGSKTSRIKKNELHMEAASSDQSKGKSEWGGHAGQGWSIPK